MIVATPGSQVIKNHAAFIWSVADYCNGAYKRSAYGKCARKNRCSRLQCTRSLNGLTRSVVGVHGLHLKRDLSVDCVHQIFTAKYDGFGAV